jgi:hypothetical protein
MSGQPPYPRQFLPDRPQQQRQSRGDDREQIVRARQAAEALFSSKQDDTEQPFSELSQAPHPRKPRILPILPPAPIRQETVDAPVTPEQRQAPEIPVKKRARVRTLVKYGMSVSQVADVYRVPIEMIELILENA